MTKSFTAPLAKFAPPFYGCHVLIPQEVSDFFREKDIKRFICDLNGEHQFPCAMHSKGNGEYYLLINKETQKKLFLQLGDVLKVTLNKDKSKYGMPMPEEMEVLLQQDPEAEELFQTLTPGKQRSILFQVGKPKSSAIRLNKAIAIAEYLKAYGGKVDLREMNEFMKEYRKRM